MFKTLVGYCDGGIGNRLNSLVGAIYMSRILGADLIVSWPINRWCFAPIEELFDIRYKSNHDSMLDINQKYSNFVVLSHDAQLLTGKASINPNNYYTQKAIVKEIAFELHEASEVVYYNSLIPMYMKYSEIKSIFSEIKIMDKFVLDADTYLKENNLKYYSYSGLHIRGTDAGFNSSYYKFWYSLISLCSSTVLLCTDDEVLQRLFLRKKNVIARPKLSFPKKASSGLGWNESCIDEYGRKFNYNIHRDEYAIKEALVDIYLLSRSRILYTSQSTFLDIAFLIGSRKSHFYDGVIRFLKWVRYIYRIKRV